jgi:hypothetical protein
LTEDYSYKRYTFSNPEERVEVFSDSSIVGRVSLGHRDLLGRGDALARVRVYDVDYEADVGIEPEMRDLLWWGKTSGAVVVIEIKGFEETDFLRKMPTMLDSPTGLRLVRLPPDTPAKRLAMLGDTVGEIVERLRMQEHDYVLNRLTTLNTSIRNFVLSGELNGEMLNELNLLSDSIDSSIKIIYEGIREGNVVNSVRDNEIVAFLEGVERVLKAFSNVCSEETA